MSNLRQFGRLQAALLAGAWRPLPGPPALTPEQLSRILPALLGSGAGGAGWWRVRRSDLALSEQGEALRQAYRLQSLRAALREDDTRKVIGTLRSVGVEPLLLKGWAVARLYPERGLRPYGDIDLLLQAGDLQAATAALAAAPRPNTTVELHPHLEGPVGVSTRELFDHSLLVSMDGVPVRVMCLEDQLRYLCLHMIKHGVRRPLQMVDIGVLLEDLPPHFDWDYCLRGSRRQSEWVAQVILLANALLDAGLDGVPVGVRDRKLPVWLLRGVLRQWGIGGRQYNALYAEQYLSSPVEAWRAVLDRWPNAVEATVWSEAPVNDLPRFPLQLLKFLYGAAAFPTSAFFRLVQRLTGKLPAGHGQPKAVQVGRTHTVLHAERPWDTPE